MAKARKKKRLFIISTIVAALIAACAAVYFGFRTDKITYVEEYSLHHGHFSFRSLLEAQSGKMEVVVTFLAILELMKMGKIVVSQEYTFDDIKIESKIAA